MKHVLTFIFAILFAFAGMAQTAPPPPVTTQAQLDGSLSKDKDGSIVSYSWKQVSGPATPTIVNPAAVTTMVTGYNTPGTYVYELTVTDNKGATGKATTQHIILAADNIPPVANADASITIQLPQQN